MMANLTAEVISIGDEMTSGARLDTNSQWLSQRLGQLGVEVHYHTTVGDTLQHNVDVFRTACDRVDVVVASGGLGPTRDDLTRDALAQLSGAPLELNAQVLEHIRGFFTARRRVMAPRNELQAMFPRGSVVIPNPHGTAPGIEMSLVRSDGDRSRLFALPGVPAEMKQMFDMTVAGRLIDGSRGGARIRHRVLKFFGVGESEMEQRLGEMIARDRVPRVGITVNAATISLRITAMGDSEASCETAINATQREIVARVGEWYFGQGDEFEQHHAVDRMLQERGESLLIVELGYAAPLGDWFATLGDTPSYRGGISLATREQLLTFTGDRSVDRAMQSLKSRCSADWVLLLDSYPTLKAIPAAPLPSAGFTVEVLTPDGEHLGVTYSLAAHPEILHPRIAKSALARLRRLMAESARD